MAQFIFSVGVLVIMCWCVGGQDTREGFYEISCSRVESIIAETVRRHVHAVAPGLLRLHFHDCFVRGCDASIMIDGPNTGRPNLQLRGYEVIDDAKAQLKDVCPGTVSCADILALAGRDAVKALGGPSWTVPLGRRDGRVSLASETSNLPSFRDSMIPVQIKKFEEKNLTVFDLVTLVGGHTIGAAGCRTFQYRLYNYTSADGIDPKINQTFLPPANGDGSRRVSLDSGSDDRFEDTSFFNNVRNGRAVLESDQLLSLDNSTRGILQQYLDSPGLIFRQEFGKSMVKMSNVEVKTGRDGEIRRICSRIN